MRSERGMGCCYCCGGSAESCGGRQASLVGCMLALAAGDVRRCLTTARMEKNGWSTKLVLPQLIRRNQQRSFVDDAVYLRSQILYRVLYAVSYVANFCMAISSSQAHVPPSRSVDLYWLRTRPIGASYLLTLDPAALLQR